MTTWEMEIVMPTLTKSVDLMGPQGELNLWREVTRTSI
jgi:hypothetical protein